MINAKIIADSISPEGIRLTTFQLRYPKFIHGEFMTHRVFSRNASSSRAIPTEKLLAEVESEAYRAQPVFWGKNKPGMQAVEEAVGTDRVEAEYHWAQAARSAAVHARQLLKVGIHKQIVNRVLEPYLHINVVVTATKYMNFFGLRLDKAAQPEIRALAEQMWRRWNDGDPQGLKPGQWHLPYIPDQDSAADELAAFHNDGMFLSVTKHDATIMASVARCARVSYLSYETGRSSTLGEDLNLFGKLIGSQPIHASPAEHQATPDVPMMVVPNKLTPAQIEQVKEMWEKSRYQACAFIIQKDVDPIVGEPRWANDYQHGNFVGWRQYRKMLPNEAVAPLPQEYAEAITKGDDQ